MLKLGTRPRPRELGFAAPVGRPRLRPTSVETPTLPSAPAASAPSNRPENRRRPRKNATQTPLATVAEAPSRPGVASKPARKPRVDRSAKSPESPLFAFLTRRRRPSRLPSRNDARTRLRGPTSLKIQNRARRRRFYPSCRSNSVSASRWSATFTPNAAASKPIEPTPTLPRPNRRKIRVAKRFCSRLFVFAPFCWFCSSFVRFVKICWILLDFVGFCSEQNLTKIFCSNLLNFVKTRPFFAGFC